eukprot:15306298-Ditylum_brightwellii.AAC.1
MNPKLSSYAFVPPGSKVKVHKKAMHCESWAYHGTEGKTIGPSLEHYRCIKCFMPDMAAEVDDDM